jgi:phosphatidylinositol glycan class W
VGSFVFSLGVVSTKSFSSSLGQSRLRKLARSLYKATPLILLGLVRVVMVKGVEYPVSTLYRSQVLIRRNTLPSTEFTGTFSLRWQCFQSLGLYLCQSGKVSLGGVQSLFQSLSVSLLSGHLADDPVHELCLNKAGLLEWVLSDDRDGLVAMNKEGLVSLPGTSHSPDP